MNHPVGPIIAVDTAAGITIHVANTLADRFKGFIKDIVDEGYKPHQIHCYASGGHVPHSRHYAGAACDFDQRCWGCTVPFMHHVGGIAHKWGLRDGCTFTDCGHIDDGYTPHVTIQQLQRHWPLRFDEIAKPIMEPMHELLRPILKPYEE